MNSKLLLLPLALLTITILATSFMQNNSKPMLKEENIKYKVGDKMLCGYVVYDESFTGKRPAVLVVHEWWGLNDYAKSRARQLAALGYMAMAVDMYGDGKIADDPQQARAMAEAFYKDATLAKTEMDAAIKKIKEYPQTDAAHVAAIGYCFGGSVVLNVAKLGADLQGVVSFHGGLAGVPAQKQLLKAKILVCHGAADKFVPQQDIDAFKHSMDSIGADYTFKAYANATHAFTNPESTATGKKFNMPIEYNEAADRASWSDMQDFLKKLFAK